jgi:hypothetical protein
MTKKIDSNRFSTFNGVSYTFPASDGGNGEVLTTNGSNVLSWTASSGGGAGTTLDVNQTTHGLAVRDVVYHTGSAWAKAKADADSTLGIAVVTSVTDTDNFTLALSGFFEETSHGLTAGQFYFLSDSTAGLLTSTEPSTYSNPLLFVYDANNYIVIPYRPAQVDAGGGQVTGFSKQVSQASHGFSVLDAVYHNGTTWVAAQADDPDTLGFGIVVAVSDANTFNVSTGGQFTISSHGLTAGEYYFTSDTVAGDLTSTEPPVYSNPLLYVLDANDVFVLTYRPSAKSGSSPEEKLLSTVSGIDGTSTGSTNLYTVPSGKVVMVTKALIQVTAADTVTGVGTGGIGIAAGEDDIFSPITFTALDSVNKSWMFNGLDNMAVGNASDIIKFGLDTAFTASAITLKIFLFGVEV